MDPDQEICLCFHVTRRKVENFVRVERPRRVGQLAECFGAGTGCGWCRPFLTRIFEAAVQTGQTTPDLPDSEAYARMRAEYLARGEGIPPGNSDAGPAGG